jgi:hypothetical protein
MSEQLISRSPDLKRLRDEGHDIDVRSGYLLVQNVPYVDANKQVRRGTFVSELTLGVGDVTATPSTHVVFFAGEYPCRADGSAISQIRHQSGNQMLDKDLIIQHSFSSKPASGSYKDYYDKMTTYIAIVSSPAQSIDPTVTAKTFPVIKSEREKSVFNYIDTASSRAGINLVARKLELEKLGIVGLGGTGSYVLDLVAKTMLKEIHLFDGDVFLQHNAFRSPGAPSCDEFGDVLTAPKKVVYFKERYSRMRRGIFAHEIYIDGSNVDQLREMVFVFLCIDAGERKKLIVEKLESFDIPFIDVGMGVDLVDDSLRGILRVTSSTVKQREHFRKRVSLGDPGGNEDYERNIQIADLNAFNAVLAVIKWKKLFGFYLDEEKEHHSTYTISGNMLTNDDRT